MTGGWEGLLILLLCVFLCNLVLSLALTTKSKTYVYLRTLLSRQKNPSDVEPSAELSEVFPSCCCCCSACGKSKGAASFKKFDDQETVGCAKV